ncbi:MAG TPA: MFS transporter [Bdellovibrionota bacterium]|nr:MFS transporter [Bdellovibrionota bacterium]
MTSSFRALRNRNYRIFFTGQLIAMTGMWMQQTVQAWLIYRMSGSGWWLGAIVFCQQAPAFVLSPLAGVVADHRDRRKILLWVEAINLVQALVLALRVYSGKISLLEVALISTVLGVSTAFEITTRHVFAVDLVGRADLDSAISLNSITINGSRVVGPALAGLLIPFLGEAGCFALNGLGYVAIMAGLLMLNLPRHSRPPGDRVRPFSDMRESLSYLKQEPRIVRMLVAASLLTLFGYPYNVLLPIFAKDILHGDAHTLGWMSAAVAVGAVLVALAPGRLVVPGRPVRGAIALRIALVGVAFAGLGLSTAFWLSVAMLLLAGYSSMGAYLAVNNTIQQNVRDSMRGRVMSIYTMTFLGTAPISAFSAGWLADHIGVKFVSVAFGLVLVAIGAAAASSLGQYRKARSPSLANPSTSG